ncbi:MAG: twin-arginine translocase TatA/TatE family subunit [Gaiellaceae bacterium]
MTGWTSPTHIILLLLIALLLFGAKRLPEIGRSLGSGMREFKDSVTGNTPPEQQPQQPLPPQQLTPPPAVETTTTAPTPEHERETV